MTYEQYWEQDPALVIAYRKAEKLRREARNQDLWLQGMYVYEAICDAAPILHAFAKRGTKPRPYPSQPYSLTTEDREREEERKAKAISQKGMSRMQAFMKHINAQRQNEGGERNAQHDD